MNTQKKDFRDAISTIDKSGHRVWVYPKQPKGRYYTRRTFFSILWLVLFFSIPFLKINELPLLQLDVLARKFIVFGAVFWPQDFHLFALFFVTLTVFIILFTVIFGRLFCGWVCPQTIFMEMVFRRIEYWIEGSSTRQKQLDKAPLSFTKATKKISKHLIFYAISLVLVSFFLSYFAGIQNIKSIFIDPSNNVTGLITIFVMTTIFYGVYARFREQTCTLVCPYGRLQGVLLDENSIVVHYDFNRGEPRERNRKKDGREMGDCIDCNQCVEVCPTGIDIRNGTQLECTNCTACMDACDDVMDKINKPRKLIRYASYKGISESEKLRFSPRIIGYSVVLMVLLTALILLLGGRKDVETSILRTPGILYQKTIEGHITNLYSIKIVNKTSNEFPVDFKLISPQGKIRIVGSQFKVTKNALAEGALFVDLPVESLTGVKTKIVMEVYSGNKLLETVKTGFIGPSSVN